MMKPKRQSHLTRGAWIEIDLTDWVNVTAWGRTSHEVRGLKYKKHGESIVRQ